MSLAVSELLKEQSLFSVFWSSHYPVIGIWNWW